MIHPLTGIEWKPHLNFRDGLWHCYLTTKDGLWVSYGITGRSPMEAYERATRVFGEGEVSAKGTPKIS